LLFILLYLVHLCPLLKYICLTNHHDMFSSCGPSVDIPLEDHCVIQLRIKPSLYTVYLQLPGNKLQS